MTSWIVTSDSSTFIIFNNLDMLHIEINYYVRSRFNNNIILCIRADNKQIRLLEKSSCCKSIAEV